MRNADDEQRMLDLVYGLIDGPEAEALRAQIQLDPVLKTEYETALAQQNLLAKASKSSFPAVKFTPPSEAKPEPATVPFVRHTTRSVIIRWAVAAGVILAFGTTIGPLLNRQAANSNNRAEHAKLAADIRRAENDLVKVEEVRKAKTAQATQDLAKAEAKHNEVLEQWVTAEAKAMDTPTANLEITGPASLIAGANNEYRIRVKDNTGTTLSWPVECVINDSTGKAKYVQTLKKADETLNVPASLWENILPGEDLRLSVKAINPTGANTRTVQETITLRPPVYATFLATDRPLYQPGDVIYFRSVTLDRSRFLPPTQPLNLRYVLKQAPPFASLTVNGTTELVRWTNGTAQPILGPDGKPLRGVGCGAFELQPNASVGEYTLTAYELPAGWTKPEVPPGSVPLASQKIQVQVYVANKLAKNLDFDAASYSPGATVTATLKLIERGKAKAGAQILPQVAAGSLRIKAEGPAVTDAKGEAKLKFTLPKEAVPQGLSLTVTVLADPPESITRAVPLAENNLKLDFFPEGGDLVAGVPNRVYFQATALGQPASFTGTLSDGTAISTVDARGLGLFSVTPKKGETLTVKAGEIIFNLPAVKADGMAMTVPAGVLEAEQPIELTLTSANIARKVLVGAYTRGLPVVHTRTTLEPGKSALVKLVPPANTPGGVTRITVFEEVDNDDPSRAILKPVAERLVFRKPKETLNISYAIDNGAKLSPGALVNLSVSTKTETGAGVGAVLWAAVVAENSFNQNTDRKARSLPAHFYLCSEVAKPEDFEKADFLLTDSPEAKRALDLVLGTQGWRRFAEQAPEQFKRTAPTTPDADLALVAMGARGPLPLEFRPLVARVAEKYAPLQQAAWKQILESETAKISVDVEQENAIKQSAQGFKSLYDAVAQSQAPVRRLDTSGYTPMMLGCLIALGLSLLLAAWKFIQANEPERKYLVLGSVACFAMALVVGGLEYGINARSTINESEITRWKGIANELQNRGLVGNRNVVTPKASAVAPIASYPQQFFLESVQQPKGNGPAMMIARSPMATETTGPSANPDHATWGRLSDRIYQLVPTLLGEQHRKQWERVVKGLPATPATEKVKAGLTLGQPLLVREYAHKAMMYQFKDATETILWQPVLVTSKDGEAMATFKLADLPRGYRVIVAGHTLDGRVGSVTGTVDVNGNP